MDLQNNHTATIQNAPAYYRGLWTIYSTRDGANPPLAAEMKTWNDRLYIAEWLPVTIIWVGVRATEKSVSYIIKLDTGENVHSITMFRLPGGQSLKQYLNLNTKPVLD